METDYKPSSRPSQMTLYHHHQPCHHHHSIACPLFRRCLCGPPCFFHHHHFIPRPPFCPFRPSCHHHLCPRRFPFPLPPPISNNPEPGSRPPILEDAKPAVSSSDQTASTGLGLQEDWTEGLYEEIGGDEEEEEPVFVMTDEWMEFFAKSEAKRRLDCRRTGQRNSKKK